MRSYRLTITTLAPLHIGSGERPLQKGIDFVSYGRLIYMFDTARVIDYVVGDDADLLARVTQTVNLASFLKEQDFRNEPNLALYRLIGASNVSEVRPQIKDVFERPYLPGSSLKGAIRTALVETALLARGTPLDPRHLGDRDKYAAQELERDVAGRGERPSQAPNYDLFRTLRITDSAPVERASLDLSNVRVWPAGPSRGIPIDVETVAPGTTFTTTLAIDDYLFSEHAARLRFGPRRALIEGLASACREHASARIAAERAFFGVGPVTVALPLRSMPGRPYPVISSEDARAAELLTALLTSLAFQVEQFRIPTDGRWEPRGDTVAICGPKSSMVTANAIEADPFLSFEPDATGVWRIYERDGSRTYESPMDVDQNVAADVAYVARLPYGTGTLLVIAGIHALGSVGAVDYLARHLADLYATVGEQCFSMVVASTHDGETVIASEAIREPRVHP